MPRSDQKTLLGFTDIVIQFHLARATLRKLRDRGEFPPPDHTRGCGIAMWKESTVKRFFADYKKFSPSTRPSWKYFVGGPVYIYEVYGGRMWGGDSEDFVSFCFVVTKEKISIKDFTAMFAEMGRSASIHYGSTFLRDVANRLCKPVEEHSKKREVPTNRRIEYDGYYWEIRHRDGEDNNCMFFDNANTLPIDGA